MKPTNKLTTICQHCGNSLKRAMHKNLAYCNDPICSEERRELAFKHFYPNGANLKPSEDGKWIRAVPNEKPQRTYIINLNIKNNLANGEVVNPSPFEKTRWTLLIKKGE